MPRERLDALACLRLTGGDREALLARADALRRAQFGNTVHLCSIVAARLGNCGEDCAFCAQSARYATGVRPRRMLSPEAILRAAREAQDNGASHFGIVTSGGALSERDFATALAAVEMVASRTSLAPCASLGHLSADRARALAQAGCRRYNHNLETSPRMFPRLCTTHHYADRVACARRVREAGMELCSGGIIGVGEELADRVDLALALRDLGPTVIPINVLVPIPGTPLGHQPPLDPMEVLATVAVFRLLNPGAIIKVAGGRDAGLGALQDRMFAAGANAIIVGNYLTTAGRPVSEDLDLLRRLGLVIERGEDGRRT